MGNGSLTIPRRLYRKHGTDCGTAAIQPSDRPTSLRAVDFGNLAATFASRIYPRLSVSSTTRCSDFGDPRSGDVSIVPSSVRGSDMSGLAGAY